MYVYLGESKREREREIEREKKKEIKKERMGDERELELVFTPRHAASGEQ